MIDTYKIIDLPNFDSIQRLLRVVIQTIDLASEDGVYPSMSGIDIHEMSRSILPLVDSMVDVGLYRHWVATSLVLTYKEIPIHKDNAREFDYSLNLPILNTENTYTTFYKSMEEPTTLYLPNGLPYDAYDKQHCVEIDVVELLQPTIFNVKVPHGVTIHNKTTPRISLALRLNNTECEV